MEDVIHNAFPGVADLIGFWDKPTPARSIVHVDSLARLHILARTFRPPSRRRLMVNRRDIMLFSLVQPYPHFNPTRPSAWSPHGTAADGAWRGICETDASSASSQARNR